MVAGISPLLTIKNEKIMKMRQTTKKVKPAPNKKPLRKDANRNPRGLVAEAGYFISTVKSISHFASY